MVASFFMMELVVWLHVGCETDVRGGTGARGRLHRTGPGLRRGKLLGLREPAKPIAAGTELACGSDS